MFRFVRLPCLDEVCQVVDLAKVELANSVDVVFDVVNFLDELRQQKDELVYLHTVLIAVFTHHISVEIALVRDAHERAREVRMTEDLGVAEWILV